MRPLFHMSRYIADVCRPLCQICLYSTDCTDLPLNLFAIPFQILHQIRRLFLCPDLRSKEEDRTVLGRSSMMNSDWDFHTRLHMNGMYTDQQIWLWSVKLSYNNISDVIFTIWKYYIPNYTIIIIQYKKNKLCIVIRNTNLLACHQFVD